MTIVNKNMEDYRVVTTCRVCGGQNLEDLIDLGEQPLANSLLMYRHEKFNIYPLKMMICKDCIHGQLSIAIPWEMIFNSDYPFRSGVSEAWKKHCQELVDSTISPGAMVEIGSNDGTLLKMYAKNGMTAIGVDPSGVQIDEAFLIKGVLTDENIIRIHQLANNNIKLVIMQNVLAHIDDVHNLLSQVVKLIDNNTKLIIEVPALGYLIDNCLIDTIYHEHYSYFTYKSLFTLLNGHGFEIEQMSEIPTHGGSIRVITHKRSMVPLPQESPYGIWQTSGQISDKMQMNSNFEKLKKQMAGLPAPLIGVGASAKATVMINVFNLFYKIPFVIDEAKTKIGKYIPTQKPVPILSPLNDARWDGTNDAFIFSWNNYAALVTKLVRWGFKGTIWSVSHGAVVKEKVE